MHFKLNFDDNLRKKTKNTHTYTHRRSPTRSISRSAIVWMHDVHDRSECFAIFALCHPKFVWRNNTRRWRRWQTRKKTNATSKKSGVSNRIKQIVRCACRVCLCQNATLHPDQSANSGINKNYDLLSHVLSLATALLDDGVRVLQNKRISNVCEHTRSSCVCQLFRIFRKMKKKEQENWLDVHTHTQSHGNRWIWQVNNIPSGSESAHSHIATDHFVERCNRISHSLYFSLLCINWEHERARTPPIYPSFVTETV